MSTLAEELLQDFEDSGSENGEDQNDGGLDLEGPAIGPLPTHDDDNNDMVLDGDEEEEPDEDEEMGGMNGSATERVEDAETTKAKVEKMQLGGVKDIRKVTTVMDRLDPLLKVSLPFYSLIAYLLSNDYELFTSVGLSNRPDRLVTAL